jgi:NAD(P)-dependent dehydrogenase (short-subunit alcohol dehydrogenase family)
MSTVVITGSTRGIGFGMAQEFLRHGWNVVVSGRTDENVQKALAALGAGDRALGVACEVSRYEDVQRLWDQAAQRFGVIHIWVNNAGIDIARKPYWELPYSEIARITDVNLGGVLAGSHVALRGMIAQGQGTLYNMEGFGSEGRKRPGMASYGATKIALRYLTHTLQQEVKAQPVNIGTLSPGIVLTDLLLDDYRDRPQDFERAKRIFNILADKVEPVAAFLVEKMLANTSKTPAIAWLTTPKIAMRFLTSPFNKRNLFES